MPHLADLIPAPQPAPHVDANAKFGMGSEPRGPAAPRRLSQPSQAGRQDLVAPAPGRRSSRRHTSLRAAHFKNAFSSGSALRFQGSRLRWAPKGATDTKKLQTFFLLGRFSWGPLYNGSPSCGVFMIHCQRQGFCDSNKYHCKWSTAIHFHFDRPPSRSNL